MLGCDVRKVKNASKHLVRRSAAQRSGAQVSRNVFQIRRPTQERGRQKFEAILDAAEQLLEEREPTEISIYDLAEALDTSPPSVYHFFPEISLVFVALAERYLAWFQDVPTDPNEPIKSWQDLINAQAKRMRMVFETRKPVRKVLLGAGYSSEVRRRDFDNNAILAEKLLEELQLLFEIPPAPHLLDRMVEMIVINDALWMLSIHREGAITDQAEEQASRARIAYFRTFLPEYLPRRS
jgi:AcrR family transcriptional regulator